jgi:hypothetical protein
VWWVRRLDSPGEAGGTHPNGVKSGKLTPLTSPSQRMRRSIYALEFLSAPLLLDTSCAGLGSKITAKWRDFSTIKPALGSGWGIRGRHARASGLFKIIRAAPCAPCGLSLRKTHVRDGKTVILVPTTKAARAVAALQVEAGKAAPMADLRR